MNIQSSFNSIAALSQESFAGRPGNSPVHATGGAANAAASGAANAVPAAATGLEQDQTHWSQGAVLASAATADSDVRLEKVAAIQQALAAGTYAVSPSDVAGKLIEHLLGR